MAELTFLQVVLGIFGNLSTDVALKLVAAQIHERIRKEDLASLFEKSLRWAIAHEHEFLAQHCQPVVPNSALPKADINIPRLRDLLISNEIIPLVVSTDEQTDPWIPYFSVFKEIILLPGFCSSESEYLNVIAHVLRTAAKYFNSEVPQAHPAFEQIMLSAQKGLSTDHKHILEAIAEIPEKTRERLEVHKMPKDHFAIAPSTTIATEWQNPFSDVAADDLDLGNPDHVKRIRRLFVSRHTDLPKIKKRFNTELEGQRGTGKTMIMKYLAFQTQIMEWAESDKRKESDFFTSPGGFIGVYSKLAQGIFDKFDEESIDVQLHREQIFEHRFVLHLLYDILETMKSVYFIAPPQTEIMKLISRALTAYLKPRQPFEGFASVKELIDSACSAQLICPCFSLGIG
jgi:hypothetical protein